MRMLFQKIGVFFIFTLTVFVLNAAAQSHVTVNNGYGSGTYRGSSRLVHVWAEANPPNMIFDRWTGDTNLLLDPGSWHSRLTLKRKNISLTAVYKAAPAWTPIYEQINGRLFGSYFPANIRGVIFRFHGSGGGAATFFNKTEDRLSANFYVASGFAVVALDSDDRVNKQWSTALSPNNVDVNNVQAIINLLIARGQITSSTPIFSVGMSNGGAFSPRVAYALQFDAAAVYCAAGSSFVNVTNIPTTWNIEQNDDNENVGSTGNAAAQANSVTLASRGIASQFNQNVPSPVYPQRFARISGLTLSDSQVIYDALKNNGFLDRENYLIQNPSTSGWQSSVPASYASFAEEILGALSVCYTTHRYFSDYDNRTIDFFVARL